MFIFVNYDGFAHAEQEFLTYKFEKHTLIFLSFCENNLKQCHMNKYFVIATIFFLFFGCAGEVSDLKLEQALQLSGTNRSELEKVLHRYASHSADSLKYRAARFLIENMPGYYYFEGEELDKHAVYFDVLGKSKKQPPQILDSLYQIIGNFNPNALKIKEDIREVDSALLCENIDHAFMVWEKYPWNKNTSFDDFCENILPYRIRNERLSSWRKEYYTLFSPYVDSLETDDPIVAAKHLWAYRLRNPIRCIMTMSPWVDYSI